MTALVYGFIRAAQEGWSDPGTIGSFISAAVLLAVFFSIETRTRQPITPLHLFRDRNRAGSYAIMLALAAAMFGQFFFLTLFVQDVLGYSPLRAGLAFLPITAAIVTTSQFAARSLPRIGPKRLMTGGALLAVAGLAWLTQVSVTSGYVDGILGPMLLFGLGMGLLFVPLTIVAVSGVAPHEAGAASSLLNVTQQVGGSLGLSILVTVFGTASNEATTQVGQFLANASSELQAQFQQTGQLPAQYAHQVLAHGISTAFQLAAVFAVLALVVSLVVIRTRPAEVEVPTRSTPEPTTLSWPASFREPADRASPLVTRRRLPVVCRQATHSPIQERGHEILPRETRGLPHPRSADSASNTPAALGCGRRPPAGREWRRQSRAPWKVGAGGGGDGAQALVEDRGRSR